MRTCPECHNEVADGMRFCPACGKYMPIAENQYSAPAPQEKPVENIFENKTDTKNPADDAFGNEGGFTAASIASSLSEPQASYEESYSEPSAPNVPPASHPNVEFYGVPKSVDVYEEVKTPSAWSFVLTYFLCSLPVINIIYILSLAFGATDYPAKKNMARGAFLYVLLQILVVAIIGIILVITVGEAALITALKGISDYIPNI